MAVDLQKYANEGRDWIKIEDGGSFKGTFIDVSEGVYETGRAKGKKFIIYHFDMGDDDIKTFSSSSQRLAGKMASIPFGSKVGITKYGSGTDTIYEVEVFSNPNKEKVQKIVDEVKGKIIEPADKEPEGWDE